RAGAGRAPGRSTRCPAATPAGHPLAPRRRRLPLSLRIGPPAGADRVHPAREPVLSVPAFPAHGRAGRRPSVARADGPGRDPRVPGGRGRPCAGIDGEPLEEPVLSLARDLAGRALETARVRGATYADARFVHRE